MKILIVFLLLALFLGSCKEENAKTAETSPAPGTSPDKALMDSTSATTIQWLDSSYQDLGKVEEGQVLDVAFRFKNTGENPLVIESATVSCGCTIISEKPGAPIPVGQEGVIKAKFDSKNMVGERSKEIYVSANTKGNTSHILVFRVEVVKK